MKPPKCPFCSVSEWRHICGGATNKSATNRIATNKGATNAVSLDERARPAEKVAAPFDKAVEGIAEAKLGKTRNRRSREAYNAYQREYMRKRRGLPR